MKSTIKTAAWICAILLVSVSCYDDGTDCFDTATRISLYPDVELFNADGTTVFLVEQNANQALRIANRAYVMENGRIDACGTHEALLKSSDIYREVYDSQNKTGGEDNG